MLLYSVLCEGDLVVDELKVFVHKLHAFLYCFLGVNPLLTWDYFTNVVKSS